MLARRITKLFTAFERLEKVVKKQSEQIASLLQLEHKQVVEEASPIDSDIKSGTVKKDYLYGMSFVTKK